MKRSERRSNVKVVLGDRGSEFKCRDSIWTNHNFPRSQTRSFAKIACHRHLSQRGTELPEDDRLFVAGSRLVTSDGFGCTSCHRIGKTEPNNAQPHLLGPDLSMIGNRIREPWFRRWPEESREYCSPSRNAVRTTPSARSVRWGTLTSDSGGRGTF